MHNEENTIGLGAGRLYLAPASLTEEAARDARYYAGLEPRDQTVLIIDHAQRGVGSASCGPVLPESEKLSQKHIEFAFSLLPFCGDEQSASR